MININIVIWARYCRGFSTVAKLIFSGIDRPESYIFGEAKHNIFLNRGWGDGKEGQEGNQ